ncbi:putative membrane spanning protein [Borrelia duttonii CR2A]|uniref:Putative membrane spanning protein n=1 Tax=Borrelia duttonii CR2A TaxID=1432657 RepID=W6TG53_9SPIR|nr:virulence associated lipoprotein [Borrelia duttonii]ETZ17882.1 putative membrane spanning protein [Borrelia duttonii CR2A]
MKRKVFIVFMLISLISLFLIACDQNGEIPVYDAETQQKQEEIAGIKDEIPSTVMSVLSTHYNTGWDEDGKGYNLKGSGQFFNKIVYATVNGKPLLYDGTTLGDDAASSKAARREIYLFLDYDDDLIKSLANALNKAFKGYDSAGSLESIFKKIRRCAKAYYIDVYDVLQNNLNKLKTLSLEDIVLLRTRLLAFKEAKTKLKNDVTPDKADETLGSALVKLKKVHSGCDNILSLSSEIRSILIGIE